jgi:hypothetical protein
MTRRSLDHAMKAPSTCRTSLWEGWQAKVCDRRSLTVDKLKPKEVSFEGYLRRPDERQPECIARKECGKRDFRPQGTALPGPGILWGR